MSEDFDRMLKVMREAPGILAEHKKRISQQTEKALKSLAESGLYPCDAKIVNQVSPDIKKEVTDMNRECKDKGPEESGLEAFKERLRGMTALELVEWMQRGKVEAGWFGENPEVCTVAMTATYGIDTDHVEGNGPDLLGALYLMIRTYQEVLDIFRKRVVELDTLKL